MLRERCGKELHGEILGGVGVGRYPPPLEYVDFTVEASTRWEGDTRRVETVWIRANNYMIWKELRSRTWEEAHKEALRVIIEHLTTHLEAARIALSSLSPEELKHNQDMLLDVLYQEDRNG